MKMDDLKLGFLNASAFTLSFTHLDMVLKLLLLAVSIGYTAQRWYLLEKARRDEKNK
jgi:hypothetical protein|tara:strand:- start:3067 stop:3237 length:171 start_codon:yes stop_codon:yes gene_type:complete